MRIRIEPTGEMVQFNGVTCVKFSGVDEYGATCCVLVAAVITSDVHLSQRLEDVVGPRHEPDQFDLSAVVPPPSYEPSKN